MTMTLSKEEEWQKQLQDLIESLQNDNLAEQYLIQQCHDGVHAHWRLRGGLSKTNYHIIFIPEAVALRMLFDHGQIITPYHLMGGPDLFIEWAEENLDQVSSQRELTWLSSIVKSIRGDYQP